MIRLQKSIAWRSAITYNGGHAINQYQATLDLLDSQTGQENEVQQAVAYERLKWWIDNVLDHSVMISEHDDMVPAYLATRQRVLIMPEHPVDHLIAMVLYLKFNAIMEGRMVVDEIRLSSDWGDHMVYLHSNERDGSIADDRGWWVESGPQWHSLADPLPQGKVVELSRKMGWEEIGLGWEQHDGQDTGTVIFPNFQRR